MAYTDSSFLRYLKTCELNSPRQVRWVALIESYGVKIAHIPGTTNTAADSLSRPTGDINPLLPVDPSENWKQQYEALDLPICGYAPWHPNQPPTNTSFHHGKWWLDDCILVPRPRREDVAGYCHDAITAGNWGSRKTLQILQRQYVFDDRKEFVDHNVRTCHTCQRVKSERKSSQGKIQPLLIPEPKWQAIHIDWVLGSPPWPPNVGTYETVLTITDRASKMVLCSNQ